MTRLSTRLWNHDRKVMLAKQQAIALGHLPTDAIAQHATYLDKDVRSQRNVKHLLIVMLKERDGDQCYLCHTTLEPTTTCIEHIIPLCYGGENEPHNIALACADCNLEKANRYVSLTITSGRPCYHLHRATRRVSTG